MCADKINASSIDYSKVDYSKVDYSKVDWNKVDYSKVDWGKIDYYGKHGGAHTFAPPQNVAPRALPQLSSPAPAAPTNPAPAIAAPPPAPVSVVVPADSLPAGCISASDLNVHPNTGADLTQALQAAIQTAASSQKTLYLPAGTYQHSGALRIDGAKVQGAGPTTVLQATAQYGSALILTGQNASLCELRTLVSASNRSSQPKDAAILLDTAQGASLRRVTIFGAASNGIRIHGSHQCTISECLVVGSNADGIAIVFGASNNQITRCQVMYTRDDAYSSDSYPNEPQNNHNTFYSCYAGPNDKQGRSFALMGSANETIRNCVSVGSLWHGIITGTDPSSTTQRGFGAIIENNLVEGNASGLPVMVTVDGGMSASNDAAIATVTNTQTSGDPNSHLGWAIETNVATPNTFSSYAGGGPGSNNTAGNRS